MIEAFVEARQSAGVTLRELAAKIRRSNSFVWKVEAGERREDVLELYRNRPPWAPIRWPSSLTPYICRGMPMPGRIARNLPELNLARRLSH
jgi:hypothetical protein